MNNASASSTFALGLSLEQDLKELRGRLAEAAEHRTKTRSAFDAIGGDDRAAEAAAARQAALVELREVCALRCPGSSAS